MSTMDKLLGQPNLLLRVVELSEVQEIKTLLQIPEFAVWILEFKCSIIKEKQSVFLFPAGWAGTEAVIHHCPVAIAPESKRYSANAKISFVDDWDAIDIMKQRDAEIDSLLNSSSYLRLCAAPGAEMPSWPQLEDEARDALRTILRRALYICDAMYDIEAQCVIATELPVLTYRFYPRIAQPLTYAQSMTWYQFTDASLSAVYQQILCISTIPNATRKMQFQFIRSLSDTDLLGLWALCYVATESFHEWRSTAFFGDMEDVTGKERAFKHCILSYGSYFLYGHVRGSGARSKHNASLLSPVVNEFTTDDPIEANFLRPGALAALSNTLMHRLDVGIRDVDARALELLAEVLGVEKKAFDNPPSTTVWGG